jgi:hypothetical protein
MQFLSQVSLADVDPGSVGLFSAFMCQNHPGLCDEWDPRAGGNRAFVFLTDATETGSPPGDGVTMLDAICAVEFEQLDSEDYLDARENWCRGTGRPAREVLGQIGGRPAWLQNDATPTCESCVQPMTFVLQLEEGPDHHTSMNFGGGGCGYGFHCRACTTAAFLWQC